MFNSEEDLVESPVAGNPESNFPGGAGFTMISENSLIITLINLGLATNDSKTMLNAATSLSHMTEVLYCNQTVASSQARDFMMTMLKDTKNVKNHR